MYINSINHFRGIAILIIVLGHCFWLINFDHHSVFANTIYNLIIGGTSFFVFISGFLLHHVVYKRYVFKTFFVKQSKHILIPYLIMSSIPIIELFIGMYKAGLDSFSSTVEYLANFHIIRHYLSSVGVNYIGYWYIPFIIIIFAMSPLFIRFITLNFKIQVIITLSLLFLSFFVHKAPLRNDYSVFQNVLYFMPIYLLGILCSEKKEILYTKLKGKEFYILFLAIALALFQASLGKFGNYHKPAFSYGGIDIMLIQKTLLCLFFFIWLNRFENQKFKVLEIISTNTLGIFFIHPIVLWYCVSFKKELHLPLHSTSIILFCFLFLGIFLLSLSIVLLIKKIFPKHSKYLIGC
jgi:probable poly-beta-1,6-N-acetyl-D-glucosamine export protein